MNPIADYMDHLGTCASCVPYSREPHPCDCELAGARERLTADLSELATLRTQLAEAQAALAAEREKRVEYEYTGNLLARIHRDGGHYVSKHGWKKATDDAEAIHLALREAREAAERREAEAENQCQSFANRLEAAERERDEAKAWKEPKLERNQPCGCVICYCESEQCSGCGAKQCDTHRSASWTIHEDPNALWGNHPLVSQLAIANQRIADQNATPEPDTRKWRICYRDGGQILGTRADTEDEAWKRTGVSEEEGRARGYYSVRVDEQDGTFRVGHGNVQTQQRAKDMQNWADQSLQSTKRVGGAEQEEGRE